MKLIPVDVEHTLNIEPRVETSDRRMGQLLIESGKLIAEDADRILEVQQRDGLRFGDAAKKLGLLTEDDIQRALARQFDYTYLRPGEGGFAHELIAAHAHFGRGDVELGTQYEDRRDGAAGAIEYRRRHVTNAQCVGRVEIGCKVLAVHELGDDFVAGATRVLGAGLAHECAERVDELGPAR